MDEDRREGRGHHQSPGLDAPSRRRLERGPRFAYVKGNRFDVELPDETMSIVNDLLAHSGDSPSDLFLKALALYKVAMDAKAEGNHLAVVNAEGDVDQDITGL